MIVRQNLSDLRKVDAPVCLAAGFFDGVHVGHQAVIGAALSCARAHQGQAWVLTFDCHPLKVLTPGTAPRLLTCNRHKLELLRRLGVDGCVALPFNRHVACQEADTFVSQLLACSPPLRGLFTGRNWRFGRGAVGAPPLLAERSRNAPLRVHVVEPVEWEGEPVSSTRIRQAVIAGELERAAAMLGRPFSVMGTVSRGRAIGRRIGFPTANLDSNNEALPPFGVHAVFAWVEGKVQSGVINLGVRPTFADAGGEAVPELHLFDTDRDMYGLDVEVFFLRKLRPEQTFASPEALREQIARDVQAARRELASDHALQVREKLKESLYTP